MKAFSERSNAVMDFLELRIIAKCRAIFLLACVAAPKLALAQTTPGQANDGNPVRAQMRNVMYHFTDTAAVHIKSLNGQILPRGTNDIPVLDDKKSFTIRVDAADIAISASDLTDILSSYVFAPPHNQLTGISAAIGNGRLRVKGKLHDKGDISFESENTPSLTSDGKILLHSEKIKALRVPIKGLMDLLGIQINDLIKNGKVAGLEALQDDLIIDVEQLLPPPQIEGKITALRIEENVIALTFGGADNKPMKFTRRGNYISYQGGRVRFDKITVTDTDIILIDLDPNDPFDFSLDHYIEQAAAGYTKITPKFGLRAYVKDFNKLNKLKPATTREETD